MSRFAFDCLDIIDRSVADLRVHFSPHSPCFASFPVASTGSGLLDLAGGPPLALARPAQSPRSTQPPRPCPLCPSISPGLVVHYGDPGAWEGHQGLERAGKGPAGGSAGIGDKVSIRCLRHDRCPLASEIPSCSCTGLQRAGAVPGQCTAPGEGGIPVSGARGPDRDRCDAAGREGRGPSTGRSTLRRKKASSAK